MGLHRASHDAFHTQSLKSFKALQATNDASRNVKDITKVREIDTVVIGNGPSALFLSYLLHGNEPFYTQSNPHPDSILHRKLVQTKGLSIESDISLYDAFKDPPACDALTAHFQSNTSMSYSTQALPSNTLADTLFRPLADVGIDEHPSRVAWHKTQRSRTSHIVLGEEKETGGQWAGEEIWFGEEEDEEGDHGIRTLSYADTLSLPEYSIADHYAKTHAGKKFPDYARPSRRLVAQYYAAYPEAVRIEDSIYTGVTVLRVSQNPSGTKYKFTVVVLPKSSRQPFALKPYRISCNNIVLATGIFSHSIPPSPELAPLLSLNSSTKHNASDAAKETLPVLVLGSGYTAADAILCHHPETPIIHMYRWQPEVKPSPLKGCHPQAYPNYSRIHRWMKESALGKPVSTQNYEGFPNATVEEVQKDGTIKIRLESGQVVERKLSGLKVGIGRRGRIDYLSSAIQQQIGLEDPDAYDLTNKVSQPVVTNNNKRSDREVWVRAQSLRERVEESFELSPNIFVIGSLTGDTLVRFATGGCIYTAGRIVGYNEKRIQEKLEQLRLLDVASESEGELVERPSFEDQSHSNGGFYSIPMSQYDRDLNIDESRWKDCVVT